MVAVNVARRVQPLLLVPPALVVALALDQGGFDPSAWVWSGALAAWAAATAVVATRDLHLSRSAWTWLASACALLAWTALSWLWSDSRAQTVLELRRTTVYAAAVLALVALARRGGARQLLALTHAAIVVVVVYSLTRYLTETRPPDVFEGRLLAQPLGYANALAALAALGIVLGVGLAAHANTRGTRAAIAATVPVLAATLPLTQSRGAAVALAAGLAVLLVSAGDAARFARTALLVAPGSTLAAVVATVSRLSDGNGASHAHAGWLVGIATVACAAGTSLGAWLIAPTSTRGLVPRRALAVAVAVGALAAVAVNRSTEPRASLWHVAWKQFEAHVVHGSGAGTFALAWARSGLVDSRGGALDAHSLYLETLAELGIVGLLLLLAFLAVPLAHRQLGEGYAPIAAGAYAVFLVHAGLDWDWEMPAVVVAGACCGAAALVDDERRPHRTGPLGRAVIVILALVFGAVSIAGARSSSEPGVAPPLVVPVLGAGAVRLPVALPVLRLRSGLGGARRNRVAVAEVRPESLRRDGDLDPRMLLRVRAVADLHAVLLARGPVLAG
jgi:hypothetical protein